MVDHFQIQGVEPLDLELNHPGFSQTACCRSDNLVQTTLTLITHSFENRPERTMPIIEVPGRPEYGGKGRFMSNVRAAAQGPGCVKTRPR